MGALGSNARCSFPCTHKSIFKKTSYILKPSKAYQRYATKKGGLDIDLWSIKEISAATGLDRKRINDYKDVVKPATYANEGYDGHTGYKLYSSDSFKKFILIALMVKLQMERKLIKSIIIGKTNYAAILDSIIENAKDKERICKDVITLAMHFQETGLEDAIERLQGEPISVLMERITIKNEK